jgi:hypothetical protein
MDIETVKKHTIYEVIHGSKAYGTSLPTSDTDKKGVCLIPDPRYFIGMQGFEQQDGGWNEDKVVYHLPKYLKLLGDNNPNITETLWVDESDILAITPAGQKLRDARQRFLTKKAKFTFSGYAISQLHRMHAHKRWLDKGPCKPERSDFVHKHIIAVGPLGTQLSSNTKVLRVTNQEEAGWYTLEVEKFDSEGYDYAMTEYTHYTSWRENRNEARAELEAKHGIDTKHSMHLVRLLRMGYELLTDGKLYVRRPDAPELLSIRNGAWSYDEIIKYAAYMENELEKAYKTSVLPHSPDWVMIENLQMELIRDCFQQAGTQL